ncbi:recombinase family protein [Halobacillus salinarum]|uniref:Recombinase family protein n=1 Tax=Halobacillus salinarum TaxID=2932257 RepID=A0ABY4EI23_9BACI|nr:recombinase family protein [Halobacillus salinarum]UOQ44070.1 recombinase family protein [Halobacillus salinarum]
MKHSKTGVGYLRVSDKKQETNHSEEIQKKMISEKANQEGITIKHWRYDKAVSAYRTNAARRENLNLLLSDAKDVDAIIFYDESRLSRNIFDFYQEIYQPLKERYPNVKFYSTQSSGEWDPHDPLTQAKFVFAAEESNVKSMRAKDAQFSMLSNKIRPSARSPVGYDLDEGVLKPNIDAPIVSKIFDYASWGHSNKKIADFLTDNNVKTKHISKWRSSTIDYILKNNSYAGHLSWNVKQFNTSSQENNVRDDDLFKVHEAIISPVMFAVVTQVKRYKKKYGKLDTPFLLRNLITCYHCNSLLQSKDNSPKGKSKEYLVYRCPNCKVNYQANKIHDDVLADLTKKWTSNLHQMIEESKFVLSDWLQTLETWKRSVEQTEEQILFNERLILFWS